MQQSFLSYSVFLLFLHWTKILAQTPATAPVPPGPANIVKILQKAGHFTTFIRLVTDTNVDSQINSQLKSSSDGITIFAPSDSAFSSLKASALTSLSNQEKVELVQFHVMTQFVLMSLFDTVSNPVMTLAGSGAKLPLNITVDENIVNITTGLIKTSISDTIYTDNQVAIYQVEKVLLPLDIFAPAPAPSKPSAESPDNAVPKDVSGAAISVRLHTFMLFGTVIVAAMLSL